MIDLDPPSADTGGGGMIRKNCDCHLRIEDQEISTRYNPAVKVTFLVLASTEPLEIGKTHIEFFPAKGNAVSKLYNLAEAAGLITTEQKEAAEASGQGLKIDETLLKGRQICARIRMEDNKRTNPATGNAELHPDKPGPYPRINWGSLALDDPKAKHIPRDANFTGLPQQQPEPPEAGQQEMGW